jgi:preprotein translocase subunit SecG
MNIKNKYINAIVQILVCILLVILVLVIVVESIDWSVFDMGESTKESIW